MPRYQTHTLIRLYNTIAYLLDQGQEPRTKLEIMQALGEVDEAANELDPAQDRMFFRLLDEMKKLGVPVETITNPANQNDAGYRIRQNRYILNQINLDLDEKHALRELSRYLSYDNGFPFRNQLSQAMMKISAATDHELIQQGGSVPQYRRFADVDIPSLHDPRHLEDLMLASEERHPARFDYHSFHSNQVTTRTVHPYGFMCRKKIWYMVAKDIESERILVFRINRIRSSKVTVLQDVFEKPEDFSISQYAKMPPWNFLTEAEEKEAKIEFDQTDFWRIKKFCEEYGQVTEQEDGNFLWELTVRDFQPLVNWLLPLGQAVIRLEPEELKEVCQETITDLLRKYGGGRECHCQLTISLIPS